MQPLDKVSKGKVLVVSLRRALNLRSYWTKKDDEQDFLPSASAYLGGSPSPTIHMTAWALSAMIVVAVLAAYFTHLDVIVSAPGRLVSGGQIKIVQAADGGVVPEIKATNGDRVSAGALLLELDSTQSHADLAQIEQDLMLLKGESARYEQLLSALENLNPTAGYTAPSELDPFAAELQGRLLRAENELFLSGLSALQGRIEAKLVERDLIAAELERIAAVLEVEEERLKAKQQLLKRGIEAKSVYANFQIEHLNRVHEQKIQRQRARQLEAEARTLQDEHARLIAEQRSRLVTGLVERRERLARLSQELLKLRQREDQRFLRAPMAGTVQELTINTVGSVIAPGQKIASIIPHDAPLEFLVRIPNHDISHVKIGQEVHIKLDAYPMERFGTIPGLLTQISPDSTADPELGSVYLAKVKIAGVGRLDLQITRGMVGVADIAVGRRRVIEYFLDPLLRTASESLKER
jgi:HlyD family type I secretion membrane fusion protein